MQGCALWRADLFASSFSPSISCLENVRGESFAESFLLELEPEGPPLWPLSPALSAANRRQRLGDFFVLSDTGPVFQLGLYILRNFHAEIIARNLRRSKAFSAFCGGE